MKVKVLVTQLCLTLQPARPPKVKMKVESLSHVCLFATLWTVAHHGPLCMEFSRQERSSG